MCVQNEYITINSDIWYESKDTSETLVNLNRITPTNLHTFSLIYTAATADKHVSLLTKSRNHLSVHVYCIQNNELVFLTNSVLNTYFDILNE